MPSISIFSTFCLLLLLLATTPLQPCSATIVEAEGMHIVSQPAIYQLWSFSSTEGGRWAMNATLRNAEHGVTNAPNSTLQLLVCSRAQLETLETSFSREQIMTQLCGHVPAAVPCIYQNVLQQNNTNSTNLPHAQESSSSDIYLLYTDIYLLFTLNCQNQDYYLDLSISAINGDGQYLDSNELFFRPLYTVICSIWGVLLLAWSVHLFMYRYWNIALQSWLCLVPLTRIAHGIISILHYNYLSIHGVSDTTLFYAMYGAECLGTCVFFTALSLTLVGYRIIYNKLTLGVWLQVLLFNVLCIGSSVLTYYFQDLTLVANTIVYTLMLRFLFHTSMNTVTTLLKQIRLLDDNNIRYKRSAAWQKLIIARNVQISVIGYLALVVMLRLWTTIMRLEIMMWLGPALEEGITIGCISGIAYLIALRPFDPAYPYMACCSSADEQTLPPVPPHLRHLMPVPATGPSPRGLYGQALPQLSPTSAQQPLRNPRIHRVNVETMQGTTPRTAASTLNFIQSASQSLLQHEYQPTSSSPDIRTRQLLQHPRHRKVWKSGKQWRTGMDRPALPLFEDAFDMTHNTQVDARPVMIISTPAQVTASSPTSTSSAAQVQQVVTTELMLGLPVPIERTHDRLFWTEGRHIYTSLPEKRNKS